MVDINDFSEEKTCEYKERTYRVRDNGAVFREFKGGRKTKNDEIWTFGNGNVHNGYMLIGTERVHRIVCTAFHGEPPSPQHVVDHIDTNRKNNRPENLRWVTKLENTLLNPITRKRIIYCCGSIEAFIEDPSKLRDSEGYSDIAWMRTVTAEEARNAYDNLIAWAAIAVPPDPDKSTRKRIDENIFKPRFHMGTSTYGKGFSINTEKGVFNKGMSPKDIDRYSRSQANVIQRNWSTPTEFPACPSEMTDQPLEAYLENLKKTGLSNRNAYDEWHMTNAEITDDGKTLVILSHNENPNAVKKWGLTSVTYENGYFVHKNSGTFFSDTGGLKYFTLALGKEWTGGTCIDDLC